jgi:hypothetical protein
MDSELLSFLDKVEISSAAESPSGARSLFKLNSENLEMGGVHSAQFASSSTRREGFCPMGECTVNKETQAGQITSTVDRLEHLTQLGRRPAGSGAPSLSINNKSNGGESSSLNILTGGHKRMSEVIAQELIALAKRFGIERLGFFTLTFEGEAPSIKDALRKFKSLANGVLKRRYVRGMRILERGEENGRVHFHCVIVLDRDIRTGFDFDAVARKDYSSASQYLRDEWAFWRDKAPLYGFGRTELLPVKSTAEGLARYVGSYIGKHIRSRFPDDKGARLVGFWGYKEYFKSPSTGELGCRSDRAASAQFAFNTNGSAIWRWKVSCFCAMIGAESTDVLKAVYGPGWGYLFMDEIILIPIDGITEFNVYKSGVDQDEAMKARIIERRAAIFADKNSLQLSKWENVLNPSANYLRFQRVEDRRAVSLEMRSGDVPF